MEATMYFLVKEQASVRIDLAMPTSYGETVGARKQAIEPDYIHVETTKIQKNMSYAPKIDFNMGVDPVLQDMEYWGGAPVLNPDSINEASIQ